MCIRDRLKTLVEPIEIIRDLKINRPLGSQLDKVKYKRLESWRSERSLRNLAINIESLSIFFNGGAQKNTGKEAGLVNLLTADRVKEIDANFDKTEKMLANIHSPLEQAVQTEIGYEATKGLSVALTQLHESLEISLKESGIRLGFNSRDGD